jgi:hypothetical protein
MEAHRERTIEQIRQILTSQQRAQFDKNVEEMKQRFENGRPGGRGRAGFKPNA